MKIQKEKKENNFACYFSDRELTIINEAAQKMGLSISPFLRTCALEKSFILTSGGRV